MILKMGVTGLTLMVLAGCTSIGIGTSRGSAVQAYASAVTSQPPAARIVEAMAGGLIGGTLGRGLDRRDLRRALVAEYQALEHTPAGQPVTWGDAEDRSGEVVAGSPYRVGSQNCRQYTHTVQAAGRSQSARGTACRNPDGSWTPLV